MKLVGVIGPFYIELEYSLGFGSKKCYGSTFFGIHSGARHVHKDDMR